MTKIKHCPFCGSNEKITIENYFDRVYVSCNICEAAGPEFATEEAAVSNWNTVSDSVRKDENLPAVKLQVKDAEPGDVVSFPNQGDHKLWLVTTTSALYAGYRKRLLVALLSGEVREADGDESCIPHNREST